MGGILAGLTSGPEDAIALEAAYRVARVLAPLRVSFMLSRGLNDKEPTHGACTASEPAVT